MTQFDSLRKKSELELFEEAFQKLACVVADNDADSFYRSERLRLFTVMEALGQSLNISIPYTSNPEPTVEWYQEHYFRPQGIKRTSIRKSLKRWQKNWRNVRK